MPCAIHIFHLLLRLPRYINLSAVLPLDFPTQYLVCAFHNHLFQMKLLLDKLSTLKRKVVDVERDKINFSSTIKELQVSVFS